MTIQKIFPAREELLHEALAFVEECLEKVDCPLKVVMKVTVAIEELFINISRYAYADMPEEGTVDITFNYEDGKATFILKDTGSQFDPLGRDDPDTTLTAEERGIGGLGIYMVKNIMDEVSYKYENGANILSLKKVL